MDDIRKDIIAVYKVVGDPNVLEAKQTIDVLQDIEISLNEFMKLIQYIQDDNDVFAKEVQKQEHRRKDNKTEEQKKERERQDRENQEKLQREMKARMNRQVKKTGKMDMERSEKPRVKQKQVRKIEDEETLD
mmetsp:Transcript_34670/g.53103  ORF Transcript_34670/g.53103 Transcript_34670/m.53103 type:complete len:132 (-) Transcript_34670:106-501(-)